MAEHTTLLVELGTEELPPKALRELERAFTEGIVQGLRDAALTAGRVRSYATPRRLAVTVRCREGLPQTSGALHRSLRPGLPR